LDVASPEQIYAGHNRNVMVHARKSDLTKAQIALDRSDFGLAVWHAWNSAIVAAHNADVDTLQALVELSAVVGERSHGRAQKDAERLHLYSMASLKQASSGVRQQSLLSRLLGRRDSEGPTKSCPDCSERVRLYSSFCQNCGHHFT
jgi:hypothetical protein